MAQRHEGANRSQRARRTRNPRIDYYPSAESLAAIAEKRSRFYPLNTNSGVIDAIIAEWAELTGINNQPISKPMASGRVPELLDAMRARMTSVAPDPQSKTNQERVVCGAKTQAGHPCRGKSVPGKRRCKWHGGCSTGPRTSEGRARALANLRQFSQQDQGVTG